MIKIIQMEMLNVKILVPLKRPLVMVMSPVQVLHARHMV
jgi:hypothetical protein